MFDFVTLWLHDWAMDDKDQLLCNAVNTQANMKHHKETLDAERAKLDAEIVAAYEAGNSAIDLADALGVTRQHIHRVLNAS